MPDTLYSDTVLQTLAADAFDVLNWARRLGFKKERQIEEVAKAFQKTIGDAGARIVPEPLKKEAA